MFLAGCNPDCIDAILRARGAVDERLQQTLFPDQTLTETRAKALRVARTGRYDQLRIFHLIGKDDCGTSAEPLKSFASWSKTERGDATRDALSMLERVILNSSPAVLPEANAFFTEAKKEMLAAIKEEIHWKPISDYWRFLMVKASSNPNKFAKGLSMTRDPSFDLDWISARSDQRIALDAAIRDAATRRAAREENGGVGKKIKTGADPNAKGKPPGNRGKAGSPVHHKSVDKSAAPVRLPKDAAAKKKAIDDFNAAHPAINGFSCCFGFYQPQGCSLEHCSFAHPTK